MKRKVIEIDKERCVGCGLCVNSCHQGALKIVDGKARLVGELLCDGLGACIAKCPQDALKIVEKEVEGKDEKLPCGCPGTMSQDFRGKQPAQSGPVNAGSSQLQQWPVQLKLLNPLAPYFNDADLLVCADCVPFAYPNLHERFLKGKVVVVFCPKLDAANEAYIEKLANVFKENNIKSITILHMEVPCCFGTVKFVEEALKQSGKNIVMKDYTISIRGEIV